MLRTRCVHRNTCDARLPAFFVDGVVILRRPETGRAANHVWTYAAGASDHNPYNGSYPCGCPCTNYSKAPFNTNVLGVYGQNAKFFCSTAYHGLGDPAWDGHVTPKWIMTERLWETGNALSGANGGFDACAPVCRVQ